VAAIVSVSVASVMGYETDWFAPLRERLRFRSIPAAAPAPADHPKKHAAHPRVPSTNDDASKPAAAPALDVAAAQSPPPQTSAPVASRAPAAKPIR
jgi:hypothetical protein